MKRDEKHDEDIINHISNNMANLFEVDSHPEGILLKMYFQGFVSHKRYHSLSYQQ